MGITLLDITCKTSSAFAVCLIVLGHELDDDGGDDDDDDDT